MAGLGDIYTNIDEFESTPGAVLGLDWNSEDLGYLALENKIVTPIADCTVEIHLYTPGNNPEYITGGVIPQEHYQFIDSTIYINYVDAILYLGSERGQYKVAVNIYRNLLGQQDVENLFIKEISPDRRELLIKGMPKSDAQIQPYLEAYGEGAYQEPRYQTEFDAEGNENIVLDQNGNPIIDYYVEMPISQEICVNLGNNNIYRIINQSDWEEVDDFVTRLYKPIPNHVKVKNKLWIVELVSDPYIDHIDIRILPEGEDLYIMRNPNWELDDRYQTITETNFQSWNDLLDSNTSTNQQIIDSIFSGSLSGVQLGIDYQNLDEFIFYSSAEERIKNFKFKLEKVEYYDTQLAVLKGTNNTDAGALQNNVSINQQRRDSVISSFDAFEKWLYYEPTSSLTTHGVSGSIIGVERYPITSWPKYISASNGTGKYVLHHTTSSLGLAWYNGFIQTASFYDEQNTNALVKTTPEFIRTDPNNDQYELFVNMIGHHFDILYTYANALAKTYKPEEQPKLGRSKEVLYDVAKSLGWTLTNGKQASALWKYKLGVNSGSGAFRQTGSMFTKTDEDITTEVWRRIVNNLPYLLKTKGTARSIKALMNTYGIPQTLLSIREYGGPKVGGESPLLIEDRFTYALQFHSGSQVYIPTTHVSSSIGGEWGIPKGEIAPLQKEFRFKPAITQSMLLASHINNIGPVSHIAIQHTASYSGSDQWGRVIYVHGYGKGTGVGSPVTASTDWSPLYDGDFWNLRIYYEQFDNGTHGLFHYNTGSNTNTTYRLEVQRAADHISGKVVHSASLSVTPTNPSHSLGWSVGSNNLTDPQENLNRPYFVLGGYTGSVILAGGLDLYGTNRFLQHFISKSSDGLTISNQDSASGVGMFSGSMQEYRDWIEISNKQTFDLHTLNPTSYVSSLSSTSSFDTLVRHYPLGTDLNAIDHSVPAGRILSSSHPNQVYKDFSPPFGDGFNTFATMSGFHTPENAQRGNYHPVEERYYVQGVSLGGVLPKSQKIRLEDNKLVRRLTTTNTGEESSFDRAPLDTNRLGLFYSVADQVNKDIFNQIGDVELDDYVGDPNDEFEYSYRDLEHFSKEYWKKYSDRNDLNAFMRIFSQFDFALFKQIKQLIPERVDEVMGLLVEPHAIERAKVRLTRRPVKEEPMYDTIIEDPEASGSGEVSQLEGAMSGSAVVTGNTHLKATTGAYNDQGNYIAAISASSGTGRDIILSTDYCDIQVFPVDEIPYLTGSISNVYAVKNTDETAFDIQLGVSESLWWNLNYESLTTKNQDGNNYVATASLGGNKSPATDKIRVQLHTYSNYDTKRDIKVDIVHKDAASAGVVTMRAKLLTTNEDKSKNLNLNSQGAYSIGVHTPFSDDIETSEYPTTPSASFIVSESGVYSGRSIQEQSSRITFSGTNQRTDRFTFKDIHVEERTKLTFELYYTDPNSAVTLHVDKISFIQGTRKVCHQPHQVQVYQSRPSAIFSRVNKFYSTGSPALGLNRFQRERIRYVSESADLFYSRSLDIYDYRDDFFAGQTNLYYNGCLLTGPAVNAPTNILALNNTPVIEVFTVSPNDVTVADPTRPGYNPPGGGGQNPGYLLVR